MKGVALGSRAQTLLALANARARHQSVPTVYFVMLLITATELILTYWATVSGITALRRPADFIDALAPTALAVAEYIQFAALVPGRRFDPVATWFVMVAVSSGLAVVIVCHVNRRLSHVHYVGVTSATNNLKAGLKLDMARASVACAASVFPRLFVSAGT